MAKHKKILIFLIPITLILSFYLCGTSAMSRDISDNVLRLHILAESDNDYDQALKIKVRDRILSDFGNRFASVKSRKESISLAEELLPEIELAAKDEIIKQGYDYSAKASLEEVSFPTKTYDNITLPAGKYLAVRIIIGSGEGHNWWCVMYPPLCLSSETTESAKEALKESLTPEEYALLTQSEESIKVKLKFKTAEVIGNLFR